MPTATATRSKKAKSTRSEKEAKEKFHARLLSKSGGEQQTIPGVVPKDGPVNEKARELGYAKEGKEQQDNLVKKLTEELMGLMKKHKQPESNPQTDRYTHRFRYTTSEGVTSTKELLAIE